MKVIIDVLRAWENWPGATAELYRELDLSKMQMVTLIKKAKRLVKNGIVTESEFHEVDVADSKEISESNPCHYVVEMTWNGDKTLRFLKIEQLVDFLRKVA